MKKKINSKVSFIAYGISVPHCYSIKGNCRVCLVELKNSMKPVVSCATNARAVLQNSQYVSSNMFKTALVEFTSVKSAFSLNLPRANTNYLFAFLDSYFIISIVTAVGWLIFSVPTDFIEFNNTDFITPILNCISLYNSFPYFKEIDSDPLVNLNQWYIVLTFASILFLTLSILYCMHFINGWVFFFISLVLFLFIITENLFDKYSNFYFFVGAINLIVFLSVTIFYTNNKNKLFYWDFKKWLANNYISFFVKIVNHKILSPKFVTWTVVFGIFITKRLIYFLGVKYPISLLFVLFIPLLILTLVVFFLIGIYLIALHYPKFGRIFINFLRSNASEGALILIGLSPVVKPKFYKRYQLNKRYFSTMKNSNGITTSRNFHTSSTETSTMSKAQMRYLTKENFIALVPYKLPKRKFHSSYKASVWDVDQQTAIEIYIEAKIKLLEITDPTELERIKNVRRTMIMRPFTSFEDAANIADICISNGELADKYISGEFEFSQADLNAAKKAMYQAFSNSLEGTVSDDLNSVGSERDAVEPTDIKFKKTLRQSLLSGKILDDHTSIQYGDSNVETKITTKHNGYKKLEMTAQYVDPDGGKKSYNVTLDPTARDPHQIMTHSATVEDKITKKTIKNTMEALLNLRSRAIAPIAASMIFFTGYEIADRMVYAPDEVAKSIDRAIADQQRQESLGRQHPVFRNLGPAAQGTGGSISSVFDLQDNSNSSIVISDTGTGTSIERITNVGNLEIEDGTNNDSSTSLQCPSDCCSII